MKHLLILTILFTTTAIQAQKTDFAPIGAKWYYKQISFDNPYPETYKLVEVTGESMFQGKLCRNLVGLTNGCGLPNPCRIYSQNDSTFFWSEITAKFELLYNFRAGAGESWKTSGLVPSGDTLQVVVDSVGETILQGDTLLTLFVSYSGCYDWGNIIMEKLGNLYFLSPSFCLCENGPFGIRCYEDSISEYHLVDYPCDTLLFLGTGYQPELVSVTIGPNPFQETITVQSDEPLDFGYFRLFDYTGSLVFQTRFLGQLEVPTANLTAGMYIWAIQTNDYLVKSGLCIKH